MRLPPAKTSRKRRFSAVFEALAAMSAHDAFRLTPKFGACGALTPCSHREVNVCGRREMAPPPDDEAAARAAPPRTAPRPS